MSSKPGSGSVAEMAIVELRYRYLMRYYLKRSNLASLLITAQLSIIRGWSGRWAMGDGARGHSVVDAGNATLIADELRLVNWRAEKGAIAF